MKTEHEEFDTAVEHGLAEIKRAMSEDEARTRADTQSLMTAFNLLAKKQSYAYSVGMLVSVLASELTVAGERAAELRGSTEDAFLDNMEVNASIVANMIIGIGVNMAVLKYSDVPPAKEMH